MDNITEFDRNLCHFQGTNLRVFESFKNNTRVQPGLSMPARILLLLSFDIILHVHQRRTVEVRGANTHSMRYSFFVSLTPIEQKNHIQNSPSPKLNKYC